MNRSGRAIPTQDTVDARPLVVLSYYYSLKETNPNQTKARLTL